MRQICFILVGLQAVLKFSVGIKSFGLNKKLPWDKFVKQKVIFCKIFYSKRIFLELQHIVDDFVDFLELSMFINAFIP